MTIKGGAPPETVFHSVKIMIEKGMDFQEAINEVESILRGKIPDHIKDRIRQETFVTSKDGDNAY